MVYGKIASSAHWTALDKTSQYRHGALILTHILCEIKLKKLWFLWSIMTGECSDFPLTYSFSRAVGLCHLSLNSA